MSAREHLGLHTPSCSSGRARHFPGISQRICTEVNDEILVSIYLSLFSI